MADMWDELMAIERHFDETFKELLGPLPRARRMAPALPGRMGLVRRPFMPAVDTFGRNGDLVIDVELPGIDPEKDVTILLEDGELIVKGERRYREEVCEDDFYRMEASYGAFERYVTVPKEITEKDVEAQYKDGLLEVVVHGATRKPAEAEATKIPVKLAESKS